MSLNPCHLPLANLPTFGPPQIPSSGIPTTSLWCSSDWDSRHRVFLFDAFFFFRRFLAFLTKLRQSLQFRGTRAERSYLRDLHVLHLTFVSKLCCAVTGTIVICLTPVCLLAYLPACWLSPLSPGRCPVAEKEKKKGPGHSSFGVIGDPFVSFRTKHMLSPPTTSCLPLSSI